MILVLEPNTHPESLDYRMLTSQLERLHNIKFRVHREVGTEVTLTEIYLIGNTGALTIEQMQVLPCVAKVVRVSEPYRVLGRHAQGDDRPASFEYNATVFLPLAVVVSIAYLGLGVAYWFRTPIIGIGLSVLLFSVALVLYLIGRQ